MANVNIKVSIRSFFVLLCLFVALQTFAQRVDDEAQKLTITLNTAGTLVETASSGVPGEEPTSLLAEADTISVDATVLAAERITARTPRRALRYFEDSIVLVGLDADSVELTRTVTYDPRLIRAEAIRGENDLVSTRFYRKSVSFSFVMHHPDVAAVRILKPRWTGSSWQFDALAEVTVK